NDRPNVMLASAVSTYVNRYGVRPGRRAIVFTNNDSAYRTALDLAAVGTSVAAIVDSRPAPQGALAERARKAGIAIVPNSVVVDVRGTTKIHSVDVRPLTGPDAVSSHRTMMTCDLVVMSGGWSPAVHLHAQSGGRPRFDEAKACFVPGASVQA